MEPGDHLRHGRTQDRLAFEDSATHVSGPDTAGVPHVPLRVKVSMLLDPTPPTVADSVRVMFVTDGWAQADCAGGRAILAPGSIVTIPEGAWGRTTPWAFVRSTTLHLHAQFVAAQLQWLSGAHPIVHQLAPGPACGRIPGIIHLGERANRLLRPKLALLAALDGAPCSEFAILARVADIFDDIGYLHTRIRGSLGGSIGTRSAIPDVSVASAVRALTTRLGHAWSIRELASVVGLSESQLSRLFRRDLGVSPAAFLWNARVDRMAELLAAGELTASQAARVAGWTAPSAASRAFTRRYGVSPRVFVRQVHSLGALGSEMTRGAAAQPRLDSIETR